MQLSQSAAAALATAMRQLAGPPATLAHLAPLQPQMRAALQQQGTAGDVKATDVRSQAMQALAHRGSWAALPSAATTANEQTGHAQPHGADTEVLQIVRHLVRAAAASTALPSATAGCCAAAAAVIAHFLTSCSWVRTSCLDCMPRFLDFGPFAG